MLKRLVEGYKVSSQADLSRPWISSGMKLPSSGHQTRVMAPSCMAARKGVSSRANLLISTRCLWVTLPLSSHHAGAVTFNLSLKLWKNKRMTINGLGKSALRTKVPHTLYKGTHEWDTTTPCMSWALCPLSLDPNHFIHFTWLREGSLGNSPWPRARSTH